MKLTKGILKTDKTYIAVLKFAEKPDPEQLNEVINKLTGRIYNVPPEISAVKVQVRTRKIYHFELIELADKEAIVKIICEAGTYIRTIARDMGLLLGYKVNLKELRRENSGRFTLADCVTLQEIADAIWLWKECDNPAALNKIIHPTEKLLLDKPYIIVNLFFGDHFRLQKWHAKNNSIFIISCSRLAAFSGFFQRLYEGRLYFEFCMNNSCHLSLA